MDIKLLVLKPVNFQKCIENVFKNTFYLTSVILIQWAWGGAQNLYIYKKKMTQVVVIFNRVWEPLL